MRVACCPALLALAACGGRAPSPGAPVGNTAATAPHTPAPAPTPIAFELSGNTWSIDVPGGAESVVDDYTHRITTAAWAVDVMEWPDSQVFVQTLAEDLQSVAADPSAKVVHQAETGPHAWESVVTYPTKISGGALISGDSMNVMCSFELPPDADWQAPLAACRTLHERQPDGDMPIDD